jgi:hypothetical protein
VTREEQEELLHLYQVLDVSGALADCVEHGSHGEGTANDDAEGVQVALVGSDEDVPEETESEEREVHEGDDCDARGLHVSLLRFFGGLFLPVEHNTTTAQSCCVKLPRKFLTSST